MPADKVRVTLRQKARGGITINCHDLVRLGAAFSAGCVGESPDMSLARWEERLAPFDGIVAVGFWVAGVLVLQGPANQPDT